MWNIKKFHQKIDGFFFVIIGNNHQQIFPLTRRITRGGGYKPVQSHECSQILKLGY